MSSRINPDSFYFNGMAIPATYFRAVDTTQTSGIDGDAGAGTWNPASGIVIGGAGMWACGPWTLAPPSLQTSVHFQYSSFLGPNTRLSHGDGDYIVIDAGHFMSSRSLETTFMLGKDASGCPTPTADGHIIGSSAVMLGDILFQGMSNSGGPYSANAYRPSGRILLPLRVHNGATLASVTIWFVTSNAHPTGAGAVTGIIFPLFRVHKVDQWGNLSPCYTGPSVGDGFLFLPTPASNNAYLNGGAPQSYTYTCDAGVVIDTSKYQYFVEVIDEQGLSACAGNSWISAVANLTNITDMRPQ